MIIGEFDKVIEECFYLLKEKCIINNCSHCKNSNDTNNSNDSDNSNVCNKSEKSDNSDCSSFLNSEYCNKSVLSEISIKTESSSYCYECNTDFAYICLLQAYYEKRDLVKAREIIKTIRELKKFSLKEDVKDLERVLDAKEIQYDHYKNSFPSYTQLQEFMAWLKESRDIYFPKLEIKYFSNDHRGVFAKNKIFVSRILFN